MNTATATQTAASAAYDAIRKPHAATSDTTCACGWSGKNAYNHISSICRKASKAYLAVEAGE